MLQERALNVLLIPNKSVVVELPSASGKTIAMLAAALHHTNEENLHTQVIFLCSNENSAENAYNLSVAFATFSKIKIGLALFSKPNNLTNDTQIIIGTPTEVVRQIDLNNIYMGHLAYVYADDADKTLPYTKMWDFMSNLMWEPSKVAAGTFLKIDMKNRLNHDRFVRVRREHLVPNYIKCINIVCSGYDQKLKILQKIVENSGVQQILITVNVELTFSNILKLMSI